MRMKCPKWLGLGSRFELGARMVVWVTGIILAGYAFSQIMHTLTAIWVPILFCFFMFAALITWRFDIKRLKKDN